MNEKIDELERQAESGNLNATCNLVNELIRMKRFAEAKEWILKVANATFKRGRAYYDKNNYEMAKECFEKAAELGNADAMLYLGLLYGSAFCNFQYQEADKWFEKAAELGNADATFSLGILYLNGNGVEKDKLKAKKWLEKAVKLGVKAATSYLKEIKDEDDKSIKKEDAPVISNVNDVKKLKDIVEELSGKFIARGETVRMLANNIYHGRRVIETFEDGRTIRKNITTPLIISSTGGGKTAIVSDLAKKFELPYVSVSLSGFTQAGYKGLDLQNIFIDLIKKANGKVEEAEKGIVVLDEFDKIRIDDDDSHRGFNMELQDELLSYLEGREVYLETKPGSTIKFDTSRVTFILCGAFQEITGSYANYSLEEMKTRISHGYKSELFARIGTVHYMPKYTKSDYFNILNNSSISPLKNFVLTCSIYGKKVITSPYSPFIESVAEEAVVLDQGVRGLENIFSNIRDWYLEDLIYGNSDIYLMASYEEIKKDKEKGRRR